MVSFKKALCALSFGIGLSASLNAWAIKPDCAVCKTWYDQCAAGDQYSCDRWDMNACSVIVSGCPG